MQIGPRIRIGGTLGHIGQQAKETLGKIDKKAAPFVAMIPGVGQIAAPIMNIAGNALDTSNGGGIKSWGDIGRVGLQSAAMAGGAGALGKLAGSIPGVSAIGSELGKIPGVSAIEGALGSAGKSIGGALSNIPGVQSVEDYLQQHGGSLGGALSGIAGKAGDFLTGNGGRNALGVAEGVNAALLQKKAEDYAKNAMGSVQSSYDSRAPLRQAGIQGMLHPNVPNLQPLAQSNTANPFTKTTPYPQAPAVAPVQG